MALLQIAELWPGDYALDGPTLLKYRLYLVQGKALNSIQILVVAGRYLVSDGNHRVRAFIEFYQDRNQNIPTISADIYTPSQSEMPSGRRRPLERISHHYGQGLSAFLLMPVSDSEPGNSFDNVRARARKDIDSQRK